MKSLAEQMKINIPQAVQIVIDDVGWWSGENSSGEGGPYRTGIPRHHVPEDYRAIAELGRRLDMCPQAAMVLCEWDRENILKNVPTSTWMGEAWDNSRWVGQWLDEAADVIRNNADHMELVLHGVGHEYWDAQGMTRCEWYDNDGQMRPRDQVMMHLDCVDKLLRRNNLGGFPKSFVPPGFNYRFSPCGEELASILRPLGVRYVSTMFTTLFKDSEPEGTYFGTEHGILTVDRSWATIDWCDFEPVLSGDIIGPVCGIHWPNVLHLDPERNYEAVEAWVKFMATQDVRFDCMLARNTEESFSQAAYQWGVGLSAEDHRIAFNFSKVDRIKAVGLLDYFYVKADKNVELCSLSEDITVARAHRKFSGPYAVWKIRRCSKQPYGAVEFREAQ